MQTKSEMIELLAAAGIRPRRRWGQNFLIDGNLMRRLIDAADISIDDAVFEVGAGTGALTERLTALAGAVVSVEIDRKLHHIVAGRTESSSNLTLIQADALASKNQIAQPVRDALDAVRNAVTGKMMLVANLPYQIATPLLMNLLLGMPRFDRFCFTVQKELAQRILAQPGTPDYGPLSVTLQATCRVRRIAALPPSVFWPRPAVDSAMMRADVMDNPFDTADRLARFVATVRACFLHRRKTLKFNLSRAAGEQALSRVESHFDLRRRPQSLTVDEWITLDSCLEEPD